MNATRQPNPVVTFYRAIPNCRASCVAWDADGAGFHYTRYPEGDHYHRTVHHHTIGDPHVPQNRRRT